MHEERERKVTQQLTALQEKAGKALRIEDRDTQLAAIDEIRLDLNKELERFSAFSIISSLEISDENRPLFDLAQEEAERKGYQTTGLRVELTKRSGIELIIDVKEGVFPAHGRPLRLSEPSHHLMAARELVKVLADYWSHPDEYDGRGIFSEEIHLWKRGRVPTPAA